MMIELTQITHRFDEEKILLNDVNLAMRRGESFVLVGPSGHGKSTLLKMMGGLIEPQRGEIKIEGVNLYNCSHDERVRVMNKIGMLFQKNALFDSLTVGENLAFPLREATSLREDEIQIKVKKYLSDVELLHAIDLFPDEISGGMQKRVGIARALILDPEIIFYDDPTAGLDPITSRLIVDLILKLNKQLHATTVSITNDMNRAFQMADRIAVLMDQKMVITGSVEETKNFKDKHIQNFINGVFEGDSGDQNVS
jgi:phospholipid/cholesterol/gamma-HCH transport system ATP-binding protein